LSCASFEVVEDGEAGGAAVGVGDGNAFHAQRGQPFHYC